MLSLMFPVFSMFICKNTAEELSWAETLCACCQVRAVPGKPAESSPGMCVAGFQLDLREQDRQPWLHDGEACTTSGSGAGWLEPAVLS